MIIKPNSKTCHHVASELSNIGDIKNIEHMLQIINMQYENNNSANRKKNKDMQWGAKWHNAIITCVSAMNAMSRSIAASNKTTNKNNRLLLQKAINIINAINNVTKTKNLQNLT